MLIEGLLSLLKGILNILLVFNIPKMPSSVTGYIDNLFGYLETGASILANYTPLDYLLTLFGIIIAVDAGILVYKFVMWVLRKIPILNMK